MMNKYQKEIIANKMYQNIKSGYVLHYEIYERVDGEWVLMNNSIFDFENKEYSL